MKFRRISHLFLGIITTVTLSLLLTTSVNAQAACSIEIITRTVEFNEPAQIRVSGLDASGSITNETFNAYSTQTGRWVDIGNIVAGSMNEPFTLTLLNDNDGNPLIEPSLSGSNIIIRRAGLLGAQTNLCTSLNTIVMLQEDEDTGYELCEACVNFNDCATGLTCESGYCIPSSTGEEGSRCINTFQCNREANLRCSGSGVTPSEWCSIPPTADTPLPGTCIPDDPLEPPIYTCTNRGGQCSGFTFDPAYCQDGVLRSDCSGLGTCWINPYTAVPGGGNQPSDLGSCITRPPNPGALKELREPCTENEECLSGFCSSGRCSVPSNPPQCITVGQPVGPAYCESIGALLCVRSRPNATDYLCCTSTNLCEDIGGDNRPSDPPITIILADGCAEGPGYINTAIGCIPYTAMFAIARFFLAWGIGVGGALALGVVAYAGFLYATSTGDKYRLQSARDLLYSALAGLLFLIFSTYLLSIIGVDILGLFV